MVTINKPEKIAKVNITHFLLPLSKKIYANKKNQANIIPDAFNQNAVCSWVKKISEMP